MADQFTYTPKSLQLGLIYFMMGNKELTITHFQNALKTLENKLSESPYDSRLYSAIGIAYAGLEMNEIAAASGEKALKIMNISIDAWIGFYRELDMAKILLMIGECDQTIDKLGLLLRENGDLSVELLKNDPFWDPLREFESFKLLIESYH
jgi:tetratricopeptide (TPR) repeat protein